ncbi:type IVB secretion system protein IcmW [Geopseudomonas aromaticivorans]
MLPAELDLSAVREYWAAQRPSLLAMLDNMEKSEFWSVKEIPDPPAFAGLLQQSLTLIDELTRVSDRSVEVRECLQMFNGIMAALPTATAMYVLLQADQNYGAVSYELLKLCHDNVDESPECNVMWQRVMMLARYQLLMDVTRAITEGYV